MENVKPSTRRSITFRMTMAVCTFVILFLTLLAAVTLAYFRHELKHTISAQQNTLLTVISQDIDRKLLFARKAVVAVSGDITPAIVADPDAAQHFLDNRPGTRVTFDNGLYLFSPDGRIIAESPYLAGRRGRDISFREFFKKTVSTGMPVISAPFISTHTPGAPAVMFTAPVRDKDGALIAILGGGLNLLQDNFLGELSRTSIAKTGYLYLFASDRTMIMHPDKSRIMKQAAPSGVNKLLDRALAGFNGSEENVNSRGLHALTSYQHLQATDWVVGANYPLSEAYEPIHRAMMYAVGAILFSAVLSILVIRTIMGRYTEALVRFAQHVQQISSKTGAERLFRHDSRDEIGLVVKTFNSMIQDHDTKSEQLFHISTHDALSGLYNRAYFEAEIQRLLSGRQMPVSVVMVDIDDLKLFNDRHGHSVGDKLIKTTARILMEAFRAEDVVARIGGDEFAVLLPGVNSEQAVITMKRVRRIAERYETEQAEEFPVSISLGCATAVGPAELEEAIASADQQMYLDKMSRKTTEKEVQL